MVKSNIIKARILAVIVPLCSIGVFIILKTKTGISIPIYLVVMIIFLIQSSIYQYFIKDDKKEKNIGSNIRNVGHISLRGIIFYAYSIITIVNQIGSYSFVLNLAGAVVLYYYNHISIKSFMGIKDLMFIVAMMSTMPLLKEYTKP